MENLIDSSTSLTNSDVYKPCENLDDLTQRLTLITNESLEDVVQKK